MAFVARWGIGGTVALGVFAAPVFGGIDASFAQDALPPAIAQDPVSTTVASAYLPPADPNPAFPPAIAGESLPPAVANEGANGLPPAVATDGKSTTVAQVNAPSDAPVPPGSSIAQDASRAGVFVGGEPGEATFAQQPVNENFGWVFSAEITGGTRYFLQDGALAYHNCKQGSQNVLSFLQGTGLEQWFPFLSGSSQSKQNCKNYSSSADKYMKNVHDYSLADEQWFPFVSGQTKAMHTSADGRKRFTLETYGRWDIQNHHAVFDLPEANFFYDGGKWSILVGMHKEFWGVAESRHLVDIVNPVDLDGDPEFENRFGQPMINYNYTGGAGTLSLYGLIGFRDVDFKTTLNRYDFSKIVNEDKAQYQDGDAHNLGFAARYSNTVNLPGSSLDYALSFFTGTARLPRFVPVYQDPQQNQNNNNNQAPQYDSNKNYLAPYYDHIDQVGAEFLYSIGALQLKFEGIYRRQNGQNVWAGVGGFEYTFSDPFNANMDLGIIGEYLYDSRENGCTSEAHNAYNNNKNNSNVNYMNYNGYNSNCLNADYPTSNAVFAGVRVGLNNQHNTNVVAGVSYDFDDQSRFWMFDASTRITENTQLNLEGRFFDNFPKNSSGYLLNKEDYLELSLTRFF